MHLRIISIDYANRLLLTDKGLPYSYGVAPKAIDQLIGLWITVSRFVSLGDSIIATILVESNHAIAFVDNRLFDRALAVLRRGSRHDN